MPDLYDASLKPKARNGLPESTENTVPATLIVSGEQTVVSKKIPKVENKSQSMPIERDIAVKRLELKQTVRDFIPRKSGFSLSSLIVLPSKRVHFETQDSQEEVLVIVRAHWITNLPWLLIATLLFLAPKILTFFPLLDAFPARFQTAFVIGWYLIAIMYVFEKFLNWFFNLGIITDERIFDVDLDGLTGRRIADAELSKIQDVTFTNSGVFGTIFNYGNVFIQTAAEVVEFVFDDIPQPAKIAEILQKMRTEEQQEAIEGRIR